MAKKKLGLGGKALIAASVLSGVALAALGIGLYTVTHKISTTHQNVLNEFQAQIQEATPRFIEDQKLLAQHPLFLPTLVKADAQVFLYTLEQEDKLVLPEPLTGNAEIYQKAQELQLDSVDFTWMKTLQEYDHLLITSHPENQATLQENEWALPFTMHLGTLTPYVDWYRLRVLKGFADGNMPEALKEARHLVSVFLNSESLIHSLVAVSMLKWESEAHRYLSEKGQVPVEWQPFDKDLLERARRVYMAAGSFALIGFTPPELMDKIIGDKSLQVGICAGLMESSNSLLSYALFPERQPQVEQMRQWLGERGCHHSAYLEHLWEHPKEVSEKLFSEGGDELSPLHRVSWMPWARKYIGYTLESIAIPNLLQGYEEQ